MELNKANTKRDIIYFFVIILILIIIGLFYNYSRNCEINKKLKISVAKPIKYSTGRVNNAVHIELYYQNKIIKFESLYYGNKPELNSLYFVAFNKEKINQIILFSNCSVPDSLDIPIDGWDKIPLPEYQNEIDFYFEKMLNKGVYKLFPKCE